VNKLPVCDKTTIPDVDIYSIFKRGLNKSGQKSFTDGNAFNKAFKGEIWKFADGEKEKIITRITQVLGKYLLSHKHDICVVVPSTSGFNDTFVQLIHNASGAEIVDKMLVKLTTEEAYELYDEKLNFFQKYYPKKEDRKDARSRFELYLYKMNLEKNGMFCIHYIDDIEMRNHMEYVLTLDKTYKTILENENKLYGKDVLIIDDLVSRGTSIKNAIEYIKDYSPKSITVLILMSKI
jgi:transcriptional regulator with PAS, ATPase and Fis domain